MKRMVLLAMAGCLLGTDAGMAQDPGVMRPKTPGQFAEEDIGPDSSEDPFAVTGFEASEAPRIPARRLAEKRTTLRVRLETWQVDAKELARALDEIHGAGDIGEKRQDLLEDPDSVLVFSPAATLEEKSRTAAESKLERIYPTEAIARGLGSPPPEEKEPEEAEGKSKPDPLGKLLGSMFCAVPTAFETRNTGVTFEVAVQPVSAEARCRDVSVFFEHVKLEAMQRHGAKKLEIKMPVFSDFRIRGLLRIEEGEWQLLSVQEPPRGLDEKPTRKRWVTLVRVDRAR